MSSTLDKLRSWLASPKVALLFMVVVCIAAPFFISLDRFDSPQVPVENEFTWPHECIAKYYHMGDEISKSCVSRLNSLSAEFVEKHHFFNGNGGYPTFYRMGNDAVGVRCLPQFVLDYCSVSIRRQQVFVPKAAPSGHREMP